MPRQKNDGRGRLGGRQKGTPNKNVPIKKALQEHSYEYFEKNIEVKDENGKPTGKLVSQFDIDQSLLKPYERVQAELALMKFHTPTMQATAVDVSATTEAKSISDRLARLASGEDIPSDLEE